jgi:hypothetical protein
VHKKKNAKSILSDEEIALKKDFSDEIAKMQETFDTICKEPYKTQQPKREIEAKSTIDLFLRLYSNLFLMYFLLVFHCNYE